jgi:hypothetical protein
MIDCTICGLTAHGTDDICTDCWYKNFSGAQYDTRQPSPLIVAIRTAQEDPAPVGDAYKTVVVCRVGRRTMVRATASSKISASVNRISVREGGIGAPYGVRSPCTKHLT